MWKISQYTVARSLEDRGLPQQLLVFNTFTSRSLTVRRDDWRQIEQALTDPANALPEVRDAVAKLAKFGIIVDEKEDEQRRWSASFNEARYAPPRIYPIL